MEYGLIGENLSHSFSKFIHSEFNLYNYNLCTSDFPGRGIAEATLFKN